MVLLHKVAFLWRYLCRVLRFEIYCLDKVSKVK